MIQCQLWYANEAELKEINITQAVLPNQVNTSIPSMDRMDCESLSTAGKRSPSYHFASALASSQPSGGPVSSLRPWFWRKGPPSHKMKYKKVINSEKETSLSQFQSESFCSDSLGAFANVGTPKVWLWLRQTWIWDSLGKSPFETRSYILR